MTDAGNKIVREAGVWNDQIGAAKKERTSQAEKQGTVF